MSTSPPKLREHLLTLLSRLPGTRHFHLHVLQSAPRKSASLFPFATPRPPRVYQQDIFVLLSEGTSPDLESPHVLVSAVEASVFHVPTTDSAILYISKVDSTGQGQAPAPTSTLVRGVVGWYADPLTRPVQARKLWVQLFARAQGQYLFPNSREWEKKKWLGDRELCAWWKRVLGRVVGDLEGKEKEGGEEKGNAIEKMKLYYVLPGYSASEAENTLRIASGSPPPLPPISVQWEYGHPYSQMEVPLPCPRTTDPKEGFENLGYYIPYFDDCPKARFMDEIAHTTEDGQIKSPQPKKRMKMMRAESQKALFEKERQEEKEKEKEKLDPTRPLGDLGKVSPDEFWERMSFRQECIAGAVTGFFTLIVVAEGECGTKGSPLAPLPGQVSSQVNKRVISSLTTGGEFSSAERAVKSTEVLEGAIRGLCEGIVSKKEREKTPERTGPALLEVPKTPPRHHAHLPEVSPNPFPEPVASLETYLEHIYGSVVNANSSEERTEKMPTVEHVQVLAVRRKKKKT